MSNIFDRIGEVMKKKTVEAAELRSYRLQKEHPSLAYIATGKKLKSDPKMEEKFTELKSRQAIKQAKVKSAVSKVIDVGGKGLKKFAEYDKKHGEEMKNRSRDKFKPQKIPRFNV